MNAKLDTSWEAVADAEVGHVYYDAIDEGVRILVLRGPVAICAYLGVPSAHPLAGFSYDDIPLDVHGGLTFGQDGDGSKGDWPAGWYWYGWDYAHSGDYCVYDGLRDRNVGAHQWTPKEVVDEAKSACWDFRRLMRLAEKCALKDSGFLIAQKAG